MPDDSHFIDWGLLGMQTLAERRRLLVVAAAPVTAAGSEDRSEVLLRGLDLLSCVVHTLPNSAKPPSPVQVRAAPPIINSVHTVTRFPAANTPRAADQHHDDGRAAFRS